MTPAITPELRERAGKDRPIIFSAPMVRALIEGRKTQTRRVLRWQPDPVPDYHSGPFQNADRIWGQNIWEPDCGFWQFCPLRLPAAAGDRLWVKEAWCRNAEVRDEALYRADGVHVVLDDGDGFTATNKDGSERSPWRSPIHMPRWASRLTLEVTEVRVERLQAISEADAIAEGVLPYFCAASKLDTYPDGHAACGCDHRAGYWHTWNSIHGKDAWDANPWVAAISFRVILANLDAPPASPLATGEAA